MRVREIAREWEIVTAKERQKERERARTRAINTADRETWTEA